jgi:hypothetical protein
MDAEYMGDTKWLGPSIPRKNARRVTAKEQPCQTVLNVMEKEPFEVKTAGLRTAPNVSTRRVPLAVDVSRNRINDG